MNGSLTINEKKHNKIMFMIVLLITLYTISFGITSSQNVIDADSLLWATNAVSECALHQKTSDINYLAVTFTNMGYTLPAANWIAVVDSISTRPPECSIIVTFDEESRILLIEEHGMNPKRVFFASLGSSKSLHLVWYKRAIGLLILATEIKKQKVNMYLLHADSDAMMMREPNYEDWMPFDISISRGTYPQSLSSIWGYTGCMGAVFFRPKSEAVIYVLEELVHALSVNDDDQIEFNNILHKLGMKKITNGTDTVLNNGLHINFLSPKMYVRKCTDNYMLNVIDPIILHCLTPKHGSSKVTQMKNIGRWMLDEDNKIPQLKNMI